MPYDPSVLHPVARAIYKLALEHGEQWHPIAVALWAELACENGEALEILDEILEVINERRAERGLPLIPDPFSEDTPWPPQL